MVTRLKLLSRFLIRNSFLKKKRRQASPIFVKLSLQSPSFLALLSLPSISSVMKGSSTSVLHFPFLYHYVHGNK